MNGPNEEESQEPGAGYYGPGPEDAVEPVYIQAPEESIPEDRTA